MHNDLLKELFARVIEVVKGFPDDGYRSYTLSLLVPTVLRAEDNVLLPFIDDVASVVEEVPKRADRAVLWGDYGLRLALAGRAAEALEAFARALYDLREVGEEAGQVFSKLAIRIARAAAVSGQRKFVDMIFDGLPYADAFSRMVALGAIVVALCALRSDEVEGAFDMLFDVAKKLADPEKCVNVLVEVAGWMARMGEHERGEHVLEEALNYARRGGRSEKDRLLMKVARGFLFLAEKSSSLENVKRAWSVSSEIEDISRRAWVEGDTVKTLARLERGGREGLWKLMEMVDNIAEKTVKAWTMGDVASLLVEAKLSEEGLKVLKKGVETARSILSDRNRLPVLKDLAVALAMLGGKTGNEKLIEEALRLAEEVKGDKRYYSFALQKIAVEMLRVKGISAEELRHVVRILDVMEPSFQEIAICDILNFIEERGDSLDEALDVILSWAESVKDAYYKACIKERVAESLLKVGRVDEAISLVKGISREADGLDEPMRSLLIGECSLILAKAAATGREALWQEALTCLERHAETSRKIDYAIQVAEEMFSSSERRGEELVEMLEEKVDALDKPIPKYLLGRELALTLLKAGFTKKRSDFIERAVKMVRCADDVRKKAEFIQEIMEKAVELTGHQVV